MLVAKSVGNPDEGFRAEPSRVGDHFPQMIMVGLAELIFNHNLVVFLPRNFGKYVGAVWSDGNLGSDQFQATPDHLTEQ